VDVAVVTTIMSETTSGPDWNDVVSGNSSRPTCFNDATFFVVTCFSGE
jgi:hypothetical protein